jgi:hypothetical protein
VPEVFTIWQLVTGGGMARFGLFFKTNEPDLVIRFGAWWFENRFSSILFLVNLVLSVTNFYLSFNLSITTEFLRLYSSSFIVGDCDFWIVPSP